MVEKLTLNEIMDAMRSVEDFMFYPDPRDTEDYEHVLASIQWVLDQFDVSPVSLSELMQYIKDDQYSHEYYNFAFQETMYMASLNAPRGEYTQ